jgi:hypothetical protein
VKTNAILAIFFLLLTGTTLLSQSVNIERKAYEAVRTKSDIQIDAQMEEVWLEANVASDFVAGFPKVDVLPAQQSKVRLIYDDEAIYIFAELLDERPDSIISDLSLRDETGNADLFSFMVDTYRGGQNALAFTLTAAGVQIDSKLSEDGEDTNWDAVWESAVEINDKGWYAEMRIPYFSLRFPETTEQEWRVQFTRDIRRHRESSYWSRIDPENSNFIVQIGDMTGVSNVKPPLRLSLNPFVIGYYNTVKDPSATPQTARGTAYGFGLDLKYGISDAFTLDMTLIPDFGQTQSDNVTLNLGPFEQVFEERRPFFTEGTELFSKGNLFFSRRVGDRPFNFFGVELEDGEELIENDPVTQLYNAFKISGRTAAGTGIGVFNAVEAPENAVIQKQNGELREFETNPLTNYNVAVIDQNLPNNSSATLINTNVFRRGTARNANTTGGLVNLKTEDQKWGTRVFGAVSQQFEESETTRGYAYNIGLDKLTGALTYGVEYNVESDQYDINDLGLLFSNNERSYSGRIGYTDFSPKRYFNRWNVSLNVDYQRLFNPNVYTDLDYNINSFFFTKSFDAFGLYAGGKPIDANNYFEPRTFDFETFSITRGFQFFGFFVSTDYRRTLALDVEYTNGNTFRDDQDYRLYRIAPRWRVNDKILLRFQTQYESNDHALGFVNRNGYEGDIPGLNEEGILYGFRDRYNWENTLTGQYVMSPTASLTLRVRHYQDEVNWTELGELNEDGWINTFAFDGLGADGVPLFDQNVNIFNIDMQYTKRFAPGSDIILVWKQQIAGNDQEFQRTYFQNLNGLTDLFQTNSVSLRIVYFLDYHSLKRRL